MDGRMPVSRREPRSWRITVAVAVLGVATLAVAGGLASAQLFVVGAAAVFAVAGGWVALRLAWNGIVEGRYQHAVDRAHLARAYRSLFAERTVEHQAFVAEVSARLTQRDRKIRELRGALAGIEMRAVEAEASVTSFRLRLTEAQGQLASMEHLIIAAREARHGPESLRAKVVPEWADMEVDPLTALVAWEEHASHVTGRHSAAERPAQRA